MKQDLATVFDYLDWRGDLSFSAARLCEADNLIFSMLSYLDFAGLVPEEDSKFRRALALAKGE